VQFVQRLAEGRAIAQIAAGTHHPVGHPPAKLLDRLEDDGLLPLQAEGVDRVEHVDAQRVGDLAHQGHVAVEVGADLHARRAVGDGLRQLAQGDLPVLEEDDAFHAGIGGVGGHRRRGVAGGSAGHAAHAQGARLGHAAGHAPVFERAGGVLALVLEVERAHARPRRQRRRGVEVGVALAARDDLRVGQAGGDQFFVAPHTATGRRVERPQPPVE